MLAERQRARRRPIAALFAAAMRHHGFRSYDEGMVALHAAHEPFPDTYFDFPVQ